MSTPKPPTRAIHVFQGDVIAARLKVILSMLDTAHKLGEGGHYEMHAVQRLAREELHDLIAEVSE